LCTSSLNTDIAAFGNGYCYLSLFHKDTWWRTARLLGPNPLIRLVYRVLLWAGKSSSKQHALVCVGEGLFHVAVDKHVKGVVATAGRSIADDMLGILSECPDAKVGGASLSAALVNPAEEKTVGSVPDVVVPIPPSISSVRSDSADVMPLGGLSRGVFAQYISRPVDTGSRTVSVRIPVRDGKEWTALVISSSEYDAFQSVIIDGAVKPLDDGRVYWLLARGELSVTLIAKSNVWSAAVNVLHLDLESENTPLDHPRVRAAVDSFGRPGGASVTSRFPTGSRMPEGF